MIVSGMTTMALADDAKLRLSHVGAPASPQEAIAGLFPGKVAEDSDGSVTAQVFNAGTLGNERQLQEGVRSGTLDATIAGMFSCFVPWAGALEAPLLYSSLDHFNNFFGSEDGKALMQAFEADAGIKTLFVVPHGGFRSITMTDLEVKTPADLKGIKIRNPNVPPVGLCLFVVASITPVKVADVARECVPFILVMLGVAALIWVFPALVTWVVA